MNKLISIILILIISVSLCAPAVSAADADTVPLGICAVVTDDDGNSEVKGNEAVEEPDSYQSYELYINKQPVLSVERQNSYLAATGASVPSFFHAEFMIPDTTLQVYLTGLRSDNIEELQTLIIDSFTTDATFELSDLSFIDTEKTALSDGDENLCWAAASSNILYYTGWGTKAGFKDEDELFDLFTSSFTDDGSHQENAMAWFFNSAALKRNLFSINGAKIKNYPRSGGYLKDYAYDMVSGYRYIRSSYDLFNMLELLKKGYGISPGVNLMDGTDTVGSHAITLWGMVTDTSLRIDEPDHYHGLLISDSDSHMLKEHDRTKSERVISYHPLYVNSRGAFCFDYYDDLTASLDDYEYLTPYSESIQKERDPASGRDKTKYPDLIVSEAYLNEKHTSSTKTLYESGSDLYLEYIVSSTADKAWRSSIKTKRIITSSTGQVFYSDIDSIPISFLSGLNYTQSTDTRYLTVKDIPAGDYTLTFTVNPDHDTKEAYYYNNSRSIEFKVRDSFIRGDYDNSGKVDLTDATMIQYELIRLNAEKDAKSEERCDMQGDGLDINDSTYIRRYLCDYHTPYDIGKKALYSGI